MKYKFIKNIQIGGSIKDDFFLYLDNNEFDKITNEMKQHVNEIFTIQGEEYYLLIYFLFNYRENVIIWLLNLPNINVNIRDKTMFLNPLSIALNYKYNIIIDLLLNNPTININIQDIQGNTPLHFAKLLNINLLIDHPYINVNIQNIEGNTPLHVAIIYNNTKLLNLLLINETINVNIQNNEGNTPLHIAILYHNINFIKLLLINQTININLQNYKHDTPLHLAIKERNIESIKLILNNSNININLQNNNDNTILSLYNNIIINNNTMLDNEPDIMKQILNKYIENNINILANDYMHITCWSTINNITLNIFNEFITEYHIKFPDLKLRSDIALEYYNIFTNENNNKQYIISAHGRTINNYFIVPSNMMIIMQTSINDLAYYRTYNISSPNNIVPPCFINKNYEEFTRSILKLDPYVYISGSLMKNNLFSFYENDKKSFKNFNGILNIEQIIKDDFKLPQLDIDFINNWTSKNENEQNDFNIKYTDINIFNIDIIKENGIKLNDVVSQIKELYPTDYIILYVNVCRKCNNNKDFNDFCSNMIEQTSILKNPKRRGSFSLSSTNIDNLLLSNHNNFQKIFNVVKNINFDNKDIQNMDEYDLNNREICVILSEYLRIKNNNI